MGKQPLSDERLWELWRQAENIHTVEVDLSFGRLVAEEAVKLERERLDALMREAVETFGRYTSLNEIGQSGMDDDVDELLGRMVAALSQVEQAKTP
jgi:hypothetical protein